MSWQHPYLPGCLYFPSEQQHLLVLHPAIHEKLQPEPQKNVKGNSMSYTCNV